MSENSGDKYSAVDKHVPDELDLLPGSAATDGDRGRRTAGSGVPLRDRALTWQADGPVHSRSFSGVSSSLDGGGSKSSLASPSVRRSSVEELLDWEGKDGKKRKASKHHMQVNCHATRLPRNGSLTHSACKWAGLRQDAKPSVAGAG